MMKKFLQNSQRSSFFNFQKVAPPPCPPRDHPSATSAVATQAAPGSDGESLGRWTQPWMGPSTDLEIWMVSPVEIPKKGMFGPAMILVCLGKGFREKVFTLYFFLVGPTFAKSNYLSQLDA